jgi:hypothetical protein
MPEGLKEDWLADSARNDTIAQLKLYGLNIEGAKKNKGSVESGIEYLLGKNIIINPKIEDGKYIVRMDFYRIEEKIFDLNKNSKITTNQFIKSYLKKDNFYMISKINNKVIVQNDNDVKLFSCKTELESERFLNNLQMVSEVKNFMIVFDVSSAQKKYLYEILYNMGFKKDMLYRKSTTHPKEK